MVADSVTYVYFSSEVNDSSVIQLVPFSPDLPSAFYDSIKQQSDSVSVNFSTLNTHLYETPPKDSLMLTTSLLYPHSLPVFRIAPHYIQKENTDWIWGIFLLNLLLFTWGRLFYRKRIAMIFKAFFARRLMNQLVREGDLFNERIAISLSLIFITSVSLFIYSGFGVAGVTFIRYEGLVLFGEILAGTIGFFGLKLLFIRLIGHVFKNYNQSHEYLTTEFLFYLVLGMLITPLMLLICYTKTVYIYYFVAFFVAFWFLYKFLRGFSIGLSHSKFSILYLFLYLCTLEILPALVLIKIALIYSN